MSSSVAFLFLYTENYFLCFLFISFLLPLFKAFLFPKEKTAPAAGRILQL
jgi:hypothetical protein